VDRRLDHREEAEKFYRDLKAQGLRVRVGKRACWKGAMERSSALCYLVAYRLQSGTSLSTGFPLRLKTGD
jgi:hypothetical protein